ncbi:MAG: methyltransferase domain-containing protein [Coxiellaceae bacterium]|nr:methyltransferase domain-containing protein [Coxiellaceae bacterium]
MLTSHAIARCFNKAADTYDSHAHIQRRACRLLLQSLKNTTVSTGPIIDIGCGTGLSTQVLAQYYSHQPLSAIDISTGLLQVAKKRLSDYTIDIRHADFSDNHCYDKQYSLMFANMALQWSSNLPDTLQLLHQHLLSDGLLAFSVPLPNTFKQLAHNRHQNLLTHDIIGDYLTDAGFELHSCDIQSWIETHKNALSAMRSIKAVGANHTNTITPNNNFSFVRQALENTGVKKPFELTHEIGFYIAGKAC